MALCRAIAVSALIWNASNIDAFVPDIVRFHESRANIHATNSQARLRSALHMSTQSSTEVNYYKLLGVTRSANEGEIKTAYRKLAKLYHPDVNPGKDTTEQFQTLNRAYEVLSDPGLKKNYDMFGGKGIGTSAASDVDVTEQVNRRSGRRRPDMGDFHAPGDEFYGGFGNAGTRNRGQKRYNSGPVGFDTFSSGPWDGPAMDDFGSSARWEEAGVGNDSDSRWGGVGGVAGMGQGSSSTRNSNRQRHAPHTSEQDIDYDWFGGNKNDGARQHRYGPIIGHDIALDFEVDFKTAVLGGKTEVTLNRFEDCDPCTGTGAQPGTKKITCVTCGGSGISIPVSSRSGPVFSIACPECRGTGDTIPKPCTSCHGVAIGRKTSKISVDIPAGVMNGTKLRIEGEGDVGPRSGPSGDLFLFLKVREHPNFRREGSDIYGEVTISCLDAIVGTSMKVPVVDGEATVDIPAGTQPGHVICVKKRGSASLIGERGDHFVTVEVEIPNGDKDKENELVQLLKQPKNTSPGRSVATPYFAGNAAASSEVRSPHNFSAPFPKNTTNTSDSQPGTPKTINASVPFPTTEVNKSGSDKPDAKATINASVPFPTSPSAAPASPSKTSTLIDNDTLATLKDQAAKVEEEQKERMKFEALATEREQEIKKLEIKLDGVEEEQQERRKFEALAAEREKVIKKMELMLEELRVQATKEQERRAHFEKIASERETEIKENAIRQLEMNKDITIRVRQSQGQATRITIKKSTEMSKIFEMVARQKGIRTSDVQFTYNGKHLSPSDTPFDLQMETNSIVDFSMGRRVSREGMGGGVGMGVRY